MRVSYAFSFMISFSEKKMQDINAKEGTQV